MGENLTIALQITLVGMGLVFAAIILLWGLMALLMRLTTPRDAATAPETPVDERQRERELKQRAAVIAVSIALAQQEHKPHVHVFPLPPTSIVSAWQAVMRADQLRRKDR